MKIVGVPLREFRHAVDAGRFKQVGILFADALDAEQISHVDPTQDQRPADIGFFRQRLAIARLRAGVQKRFHRAHARGFELFRINRSDAFDFSDGLKHDAPPKMKTI